MDDTEYAQISDSLDAWKVKDEIKIRDGGMWAHVITMPISDAIALAQWIVATCGKSEGA